MRTGFTALRWSSALGLLAVLAVPVSAQITGFNNGTGFTGNSTKTGLPTFGANSVTLTDNNQSEDSSAYFNIKQDITHFTTQFTYQPSGSRTSDGATFILQNVGLNALSTANGGSGLGINGLSPSAEVEFNIYTGHTVGTNFETNGANSQSYKSTAPVVLNSGDPIQVNLAYDGTTLSETLTDLTTSSVYSTSYTTNLVSVLGGNTAYVGFTAATGGGVSTQTFSNFTYTPAAVPEPGTVALLIGSGITGGLFLRRRRK